MYVNCVICGNEFKKINSSKACSVECRRVTANAYSRERYYKDLERSRERNRLAQRKYNALKPKTKLTRACVICKSPFHPRGPQITCKAECRISHTKNSQREWWGVNGERERARKRKNKAYNALIRRRWVARNPEKAKEISRKSGRKYRYIYREKVRESNRIRSAKWRKENFDLYVARYKARPLESLREANRRFRRRKKERLDVDQLTELQNIKLPTKKKAKTK
jgi:hypothetical protein